MQAEWIELMIWNGHMYWTKVLSREKEVFSRKYTVEDCIKYYHQSNFIKFLSSVSELKAIKREVRLR